MRSILAVLLLVAPAFAQDSFISGNSSVQTIANVPYMAGAGGFIVTNFNDVIVNHLLSGTFTTTASTYTTAGSAQPAPNSLILVDVVNTKATAANTPSAITAFGLTFNQITNCPFGTSSTNNHTCWIAQGAAPTFTTIAVAFGGVNQLGCIIECYEIQNAFVGASAVNAIVASYTNGTTAASANPVLNYTTPSGIGTNIMWMFIADNVNDTTSLTANTNWFRHEKIAHGTTLSGLSTHFQANCINASSATVTATSRAWSIIGFEIKPSVINDPTTQPAMVQSTAWNTVGESTAGANFFTNYFCNVTLPGNMVLAHVVYDQTGDAGRHISSLSDNKGSTYVKTYAITNQDVFEYWVLTNNPGGLAWISVVFSTGVTQDFHFEFSEWAHVALYQPQDVANFSAPTAISMDYGSITSSIDGELIIGHALDVQNGSINGNNNVASQMYHGGGHHLFTLSHLVGSSGWMVQTKAAQVDPLLLVASLGANASDLFVNQTIAFKRGPGGTLRPTNILYIARMQQEWVGSGDVMLVPFEGNLIHVSDSDSVVAGSNTAWASFPASGSSLWTIKAANNGDGPQFGFLTNSIGTKGIPIQIKVTTTHSVLPGFSYDVFGASVFPFDSFTLFNNGGASSPTNSLIYGSTNTPTFSNELLVEECTTGTGPFCNYHLPVGASFISTWYTNSDDLNKLNQGTANGSYYSSNTTPVFFALQFSNNIIGNPGFSNTSWCDAIISYKPNGH